MPRSMLSRNAQNRMDNSSIPPPPKKQTIFDNPLAAGVGVQNTEFPPSRASMHRAHLVGLQVLRKHSMQEVSTVEAEQFFSDLLTKIAPLPDSQPTP